jgi:hypothetical protein
MSGVASLLEGAARIYAGAVAAAAVCSGAVRVLGADAWARAQLDLEPTAASATPPATTAVAAANLRLAGAALVGALVVQHVRGIRLPVDVALAAVAALNLAVIGLAFGGYGARLAAAVAAHGTLELAGFALAASAYLAARRAQLTVRLLIAAALLAVVSLGLAAVVETSIDAEGVL